MPLTTGQIEGQEIIDIDRLEAELSLPTAYKVFVDTIDEKDGAYVDGDVLVVQVARSVFDAAEDKYDLVKERVEAALKDLDDNS